VPLDDDSAAQILACLQHVLTIRDRLDSRWAALPAGMTRHDDKIALVLDDPGGLPLHAARRGAMAPGEFLDMAIAITEAVQALHEEGLIHGNLSPSNVLQRVQGGRCQAWLTGFGFAACTRAMPTASRAPQAIRRTFAYLAPEQTGRINRTARCAQRPVRARMHVLRDADGRAAVRGNGPDGMDPLACRKIANTARRAGVVRAPANLDNRYEAAGEGT
jgi:serine/threonine protein kinase